MFCGFMLIEEPCLGQRDGRDTAGDTTKHIKYAIIHNQNNLTFTTLHWQLVNRFYRVPIESLFARKVIET